LKFGLRFRRQVGTFRFVGAETTELIRKIMPSAPDEPDKYIVQVFKCDRYGRAAADWELHFFPPKWSPKRNVMPVE